jgi:hypothetical protein
MLGSRPAVPRLPDAPMRRPVRPLATLAAGASVALEMRLSAALLLFGIGIFACLLLVPVVGIGQFPPYPEMKWQDVLDLAVPLVMAPLYWLIVRQYGTSPQLGRWEALTFLLLIAVWIDAHGMHLAANSINNYVDDPSAPGAGLIHFWDEVLSHYLWHAAMIGLLLLAVARQWRHPLAVPATVVDLVSIGIAAALYGVTLMIVTAEGGTGPLMIPAALVIAVVVAHHSRARLRLEPVSAFALWADVLALVILAAWFVYWGFDLKEPMAVLK